MPMPKKSRCRDVVLVIQRKKRLVRCKCSENLDFVYCLTPTLEVYGTEVDDDPFGTPDDRHQDTQPPTRN